MLNFTTISAIIYEPLLATERFFFCAVGQANLLTSFDFGGGLLCDLAMCLTVKRLLFSCPLCPINFTVLY